MNHIYKNHYEGAKEMVNRPNKHLPIYFSLPDNFYDRAEQKDEDLVSETFKIIKAQYNPQDKIESITPKSITV